MLFVFDNVDMEDMHHMPILSGDCIRRKFGTYGVQYRAVLVCNDVYFMGRFFIVDNHCVLALDFVLELEYPACEICPQYYYPSSSPCTT